MPCMCGAIDCPSCGPAQGYEVYNGKNVWRCTKCKEVFDENDLNEDSMCEECVAIEAENTEPEEIE